EDGGQRGEAVAAGDRPAAAGGGGPGMNAHANEPLSSEAGDDPRVLAAVKEYQAELDRGRRPDRAGFLARHPEVAAAVGPYLDGLDILQQGAKNLSGSHAHHARLDTGLSRGDRLGEFELVREIGRGG